MNLNKKEFNKIVELFFILFFVISSSEAMDKISNEKEANEEFFIFSMGQGNSQFAVYPKQKLGFLYDCGSSAETVLTKINRIQFSEEEYVELLKRKTHSDIKLSSMIEEDDEEEAPGEDEEKAKTSKKSNVRKSIESQKSFESYDKKESLKISQNMHIKDVIESYELDNLFVLLSHSDKDHINKVSSVVPEINNLYFILYGDFLTSMTQPVKEIFNFIANNKTSQFSLPYFWKHKNYKKIKEGIKNNQLDKIHGLKDEHLEHFPSFFSGSFSEFLNKTKEEDVFTFQETFLENVSFITKDVYLWSCNKISDDPNRQCPVISFPMRELGMTFICTGDAHDDVFGDILQKDSEISLKPLLEKHINFKTDICKGKNALTLLMLPHHGSKENLSYKMLTIFKPHILAIPAGAGTVFDHPHTSLVNSYKKYYKNSQLLEKTKEFWENFDNLFMPRYLSFEKIKIEKEERFHTTLHNTLYKEPVFLSTNFSGTIRINKEGFSSQYTHWLKVDDKYYDINVGESLPIDKKNEDEKIYYKKEEKEKSFLKRKRGENSGFADVFQDEEDKEIIVKVLICEKNEYKFYHGKQIAQEERK